MVILGFDIGKAFAPDVSLLETVVRGATMYFTVYLLLRVVLRGRTSAVTMSDVIVIVLIADGAQNAMSSSYLSVTNGIVLVATIVACSFIVDWLAFRFPIVRNFVHPERKALVLNGRVIRKALAEELMTEGELMSQLRLNGIEEPEEAKSVYLEGNGEVSVIPWPAPTGAKAAPAQS